MVTAPARQTGGKRPSPPKCCVPGYPPARGRRPPPHNSSNSATTAAPSPTRPRPHCAPIHLHPTPPASEPTSPRGYCFYHPHAYGGEVGAQCPRPQGQEHCGHAHVWSRPYACCVATFLLRDRSRRELPPAPIASTSQPGPHPVCFQRSVMRHPAPAPSSVDTDNQAIAFKECHSCRCTQQGLLHDFLSEVSGVVLRHKRCPALPVRICRRSSRIVAGTVSHDHKTGSTVFLTPFLREELCQLPLPAAPSPGAGLLQTQLTRRARGRDKSGQRQGH
jgi:hypothetical protein